MLNKTKVILPIAILFAAAAAWQLIKQNPPESRRGRGAPPAKMLVEVKKVEPVDFQIKVDSFGTVKTSNSELVSGAGEWANQLY